MKDVEVGRLELVWVVRESEVDDGRDVELPPEVVLVGGVVDELSLEVGPGVELREYHQGSNFRRCCHVRRRTLTVVVGG